MNLFSTLPRAVLPALALLGCSTSQDHPVLSVWSIGPVIDGKNYSHNVPPYPAQDGGGFYIDFPSSDGVHYVTEATGPLNVSETVTLKYRVDLDPGAKFVASSDGVSPAIGPTIYFQKCNDDWNTDGGRWWATFAAPLPIIAGEHEIAAPLASGWTSVENDTEANSPRLFEEAALDACRIGFTFGGGTGYGHGAYVVGGKGRITVESFVVR